MSETKKPYDLEERTFLFAQPSIGYFKNLPRSINNLEISKQGIRSSGSVGANFIEANEAMSRKNFLMRIKICRKEAKRNYLLVAALRAVSKSRDRKEASYKRGH